jgi:hypothetical protein
VWHNGWSCYWACILLLNTLTAFTLICCSCLSFYKLMALEQEEDCDIFTQHDCARGLESWIMLREHASRITGTEMRYLREWIGKTRRDRSRNSQIRGIVNQESVTKIVDSLMCVWHLWVDEYITAKSHFCISAAHESYYVLVHFPWPCIKPSAQIHVYDAKGVSASRRITMLRMWHLTLFF